MLVECRFLYISVQIDRDVFRRHFFPEEADIFKGDPSITGFPSQFIYFGQLADRGHSIDFAANGMDRYGTAGQ